MQIIIDYTLTLIGTVFGEHATWRSYEVKWSARSVQDLRFGAYELGGCDRLITLHSERADLLRNGKTAYIYIMAAALLGNILNLFVI